MMTLLSYCFCIQSNKQAILIIYRLKSYTVYYNSKHILKKKLLFFFVNFKFILKLKLKFHNLGCVFLCVYRYACACAYICKVFVTLAVSLA